MKQRSLRLRLLGGAALWIVVALVAAGTAIGWIFTANVERSMHAQLIASLNRLVAQIDPVAPAPVDDAALPDPRYGTPLSGIYWQVEALPAGANWRSASLFDHVLDTTQSGAADGAEHFVTLTGPADQSLSALVREVSFGSGADQKRFKVTLAEDRGLLDESIREFGDDLMVALAVLGLALILAAVLQVQLGLMPLAVLRRGIGAVRRGVTNQLQTTESEVMPLVGEVNELLAHQQKSMEFARARAADLAHGLKTPLSVLRNLAADLEANGNSRAGDTIDEIVGEMDDRIEYQLRLSRLRMRTSTHQLSASLDDTVTRTVAVLNRTSEGEGLDWQVELDQGVRVDIDPHDLMELVGVVLENAAKWGRTRVVVKGRGVGGEAILRVADDGSGLTEKQIARLGVRGQRHDESRHGFGLGLAIALEVVALNAGTMHFARAAEGGLEVVVRLPLA